MGTFKILFITDRFLPTPTANTINTINIVNELQNRGHEIICIATNQDEGEPFTIYDSIKVYSIKSTKYGRLLKREKEGVLGLTGKLALKILSFNRKVDNLFNIYKFPDVDPKQSASILNLAQKLQDEEFFDCVIGVFRPFSSVSATISLKRNNPHLLCGAYYLDILSGAKKPSLVPNSIYKRLCYRGEVKAFNELDFILMAKGGKGIYSDKAYNAVNSKIKYIDFPVFKKNIKFLNSEVPHYDKSKINLVYAGTLNKEYRNPSYMLKIIDKASKKMGDIVLHLYGSGDCSSIIKAYKDECSYQIIEHGMVSHNEVLAAMQQADFLINISNRTQNMVPSKIFELFSMGKPIINFISNKSDLSMKYFDKYPAVCKLYEWKSPEDEALYFINFITKEKGKKYDVQALENEFKENTPSYTVDLIEKYIGDRNFLEGN